MSQRKYSSIPERQRAYRQRSAQQRNEGAKAKEQMERLKGAVSVAVKNGTLPKKVGRGFQTGEWVENLIAYLSKQQTLDLRDAK